MDVRRVIMKLDELNNSGKEAEAKNHLEHWLNEARAEGDWKSELSILSELLGQYRRLGEKENGLQCVEDSLKIIHDRKLEGFTTTATIMLNAATTMKAFGKASESITIFEQVEQLYSKKLTPDDYRFAGLYNNMALSYADIGQYENAEKYFTNAIDKINKIENHENDMAVTMCNLAELYEKMGKDEKAIFDCIEKAYELLSSQTLPQDGYHAFTVSKCIATFDYFGFFMYSKKLKEKVEKIYANR